VAGDDKARYALAVGIENHSIVTDFLGRIDVDDGTAGQFSSSNHEHLAR
jgi:hypothetical protein